MESETEFLLRRASEESRKAIDASEPTAALAHENLAIRYSAKAVIALVDDDEPASEVATASLPLSETGERSQR